MKPEHLGDVQHPPLSPGTVIRESSPHLPRVITTHDELRIELPLRVTLESLAYIGVVSHQTWHVTPHDHDHFELCFVAEGRGWFALDTVLYSVREGDLFLYKPQEVHYGAALGENPFRLYYLGFHLGTMRSLETAFYGLTGSRVVRDQDAIIHKSYQTLLRELEATKPFRAEMVEALLLQLLVAALRAYDSSPSTGAVSTTLTPAIRRVLDALHARIGARIEIGTLAQLAHLSRAQFDREFKRQLGVPPGAYVRDLCLERAKHLLREDTASISEIANTLEFSSLHTFSIFFKRHIGRSPRAYRIAQMGAREENV